MRIEIPGDPIPKARHRSFIQHGHIATYDTQLKQMTRIRLEMIEQRGEWKHEDQPLKVDLIFQLNAKKGASKAESSIRQWWSHFHNFGAAAVKRIDLDNICKTYFDCGNEILWSDDRFIVELTCKKVYSETPCTIIEITPIPEVKMSEKLEKVYKTFSPCDMTAMFTQLADVADEICSPFAENDKANLNLVYPKAAQMLIDFADKWADKLKKIKGK